MQASEKEEFRNYLEKSGVIDALTKVIVESQLTNVVLVSEQVLDTERSKESVLVGLYEEPEKPSDALDWIKKHLGSVIGIDIDALKKENDDLKKQNSELQQKVEELSKKK